MIKFTPTSNSYMSTRAGTVKSDIGFIPTPQRSLTLSEFKEAEKLSEMGVDIKFPHQIFEINKFFKDNTIRSLKPESEVFDKQKTYIEKFSDAYVGKLSLFHPIVKSGTIISDEANEALIELQIQADIDMITVLEPHHNSTLNEFKNRLDRSIEIVEESKGGTGVRSVLPILRMDSEDERFKNKIDLVSDLDSVAGINLVYSSIKSNFPNYLELMKFSEENNKLIYMSEIDRTWRSNKKTSIMHFLQLFGIDMFGVKSGIPLPFGIINVKKKTPQRFDGGSLGLITPKEHKNMYGNAIGCTSKCPICKDKATIEKFYDVYYNADILSPSIKIHESFESLAQFLIGRQNILDNTFRKNYIVKRKFLADAVRGILNQDPTQGNLFGQ